MAERVRAERRRQNLPEICVIIPTPDGASERLRFEPLCGAHAEPLSEVLLDPAIYRFIPGPHPTSIWELADDFERLSKGPAPGGKPMRWWNVGVFAADSHAGLGQLQATIYDNWAEIAYVFGSKHWGQGLAQESMRWFHERLREDGAAGTLWATVAPENEPSVRLLTRLGYAPVADGWPELGSYDEGDLVFCRSCR